MKKLDESNIILLTDSYKPSHWKMYPPALQKLYSNFESRGGMFTETVWFGLQAILKRYFVGRVVTRDRIDEAESILDAHVGPGVFNRRGWEHIVRKHGGYLPLLIKSVPEGTIVPVKNVLMTVENTDPECGWLTNYVETLLVQAWYPMTVATLSHEIKKVILKNLEETGTPSLVNFKLHDFGFRGVSSVESAGMGGMAHLVNFLGSDTMEGLLYARNYYGAKMAGFSIPAAEHSTIVSWGREGEKEAFARALEQYPSGLLAVVSDTYDIFKACSELWGKEFKDNILSRDGTLVIRPDSGDPKTILLKVLDILWDKFGGVKNDKGYKVLNDKVRVIQGDGVNYNSIKEILAALKEKGWSGDNLALGMGGKLLQGLDRDTQKCAFKASSVVVDAIPYDVWKDPVTDSGKKSKRGRLALVKSGGAIKTIEGVKTAIPEDILKTVFWDGELREDWTWEEVCSRASEGFKSLAKV